MTTEPKRHDKKWEREETLAALHLYSRMRKKEIHNLKDRRILRLAELLERKPRSIYTKICNLASCDSKRTMKGEKGLDHGGKMTQQVWAEFERAPRAILYESAQIVAGLEDTKLEPETPLELEIVRMPEGTEKERFIRARIGQDQFRHAILSSYNDTCCITDIAEPTLLIASHIVPWSENSKERLNPHNGLCLNALHDRAFDRGLISIDPDRRIHVSKRILKAATAAHAEKMQFIAETDGEKIKEPDKFRPNPEFLDYHYRNVFVDRQ